MTAAENEASRFITLPAGDEVLSTHFNPQMPFPSTYVEGKFETFGILQVGLALWWQDLGHPPRWSVNKF